MNPDMLPGPDPMAMGGPGGAAPGGLGGAAPSAGKKAEDTLLFRQVVPRSKLIVVKQPKLEKPRADVITRQPIGGGIARFYQFRYFVKGDAEALLPFLNPPTSDSLDTGSSWLVRVPAEFVKGKRTRGEWENLFCMHVVPDEPALKSAHSQSQARLASMRRSAYPRKVYVVDATAGESLPVAAQLQAGDAVASITSNPQQRAMTYAALAQQASSSGRRAEAKIYGNAALSSLGDAVYENGHGEDALWLYQKGPSVVK